jgi:hypothetical protein
MNFLKTLNYGTHESNLINYTILLLSFYYAYEKRDDMRIYIVSTVSIFIQLALCTFLFPCRGISIIYCFIFGFLIKAYLDENRTKKATNLAILLSFLLVLSGLSFDIVRTYPLLLLGFLAEHALFTSIGVLFAFIPPIKNRNVL